MSSRIVRCPCGSGEPSHWLHDAKGIPAARVCSKCIEEKKKKFRPEVFTDPGYQTEEPVDGD